MLTALICNCTGSESLIRSFLKGAHVPRYMSVPVHRGEAAKQWALSRGYQDLFVYLSKHASYAVLVGEDQSTGQSAWEDVSGRQTAQIRASLIAENFSVFD